MTTRTLIHPPRGAGRSQAGVGGADQDAPALLTPDDVVGRRLTDAVEVGRVELQMAALTPTPVQRRRADTAGRRSDLLVERDEVVRERARELGALGARLVGLGVDL